MRTRWSVRRLFGSSKTTDGHERREGAVDAVAMRVGDSGDMEGSQIRIRKLEEQQGGREARESARELRGEIVVERGRLKGERGAEGFVGFPAKADATLGAEAS